MVGAEGNGQACGVGEAGPWMPTRGIWISPKSRGSHPGAGIRLPPEDLFPVARPHPARELEFLAGSQVLLLVWDLISGIACPGQRGAFLTIDVGVSGDSSGVRGRRGGDKPGCGTLQTRPSKPAW